jgi:hypothetical protein
MNSRILSLPHLEVFTESMLKGEIEVNWNFCQTKFVSVLATTHDYLTLVYNSHVYFKKEICSHE